MPAPPTAEQVNYELAERRLAHFIRLGWPNIDSADYCTNWHIDAICEHLEAVANGDIRRLLVNVPPRSMKSIAVGPALSAWIWAQRKRSPLTGPTVGILSASYSQHLSIRFNVTTRRLIESNWYQWGWSDRFELTADQNTKQRFENDKGGYRIATSVDGTLTGDGGDLIVIDDPISAGDALSPAIRATANQWFDQTLSTRLNDSRTGAFVIVMQRLHEADLTGHLLAKEDRTGWTHLCLPMRYERDHPFVYVKDPRKIHGELLWPARVPEAEVRKLETSMGSYAAAGQLQQRPAPRGGGMFQRHWFETVNAAPAGLEECRGWDFAASVAKPGSDPDWTAGVRIGRSSDGFYYITDVVRFRDSAAVVERMLLTTARQDGKACRIRIPQDPGQAGKGQASSFTRLLSGYLVRAVPPTGSKEMRAAPFAAQCEAGNVKIVRGAWNEAFLSEIEVFPFGKHEDQTDGVSDAFNELAEGGRYAGFLAMIREDLAAKNEQQDTIPDELRAAYPAIDCPFAKGSLEYEKFMVSHASR